jgi:hypothetical protein
MIVDELHIHERDEIYDLIWTEILSFFKFIETILCLFVYMFYMIYNQ